MTVQVWLAFIVASPLAFNRITIFGVAYLCYLRWQQFMAEVNPVEIGYQSHSTSTHQALFTRA